MVLELVEKETLNKEDLERILAPVRKRPPHNTFAGFGKRTRATGRRSRSRLSAVQRRQRCLTGRPGRVSSPAGGPQPPPPPPGVSGPPPGRTAGTALRGGGGFA